MEIGGMLAWLYPQAIPNRDYRVEQHGEGQPLVISAWNVEGEAKPTLEYLASREAEYLALHPNWTRRREAVSALGSKQTQTVILKALGKVLLDYFASHRDYLALVRAKVNNPGITTPLPAPPATKTAADLLQDLQNAIEAGSGD